MPKMIKQLFNIEVKGVDKDNNSLTAIFSTQSEDRHGDVVMQEGFDLKAFKKNPVILNSHKHNDVTEIIGKAFKIKIENKKLVGSIKFAVEENPKAKIIFDLYAGGYANAFSVGFIAKEFDPKDYSKIIKSELLEISAVSVPANSQALADAKSKGIDVDKLYESNTNNVKNKKTDGKSAKHKSSDSKAKRDKDKTKKDDGNKGVQINKEFENWDETNEAIRFKVRDLAEFVDGSLEKITGKESVPQIFAIAGLLPGHKSLYPQMYFFPKSDGWTKDDAKKWFSSRQLEAMTGKPIRIAKPDAKETDGVQMIENEDSINIGKGLSKNDQIKDVLKIYKDKKISALNRINEAVKLVHQSCKGQSSDKETNNQIINRAVKTLLLMKDKNTDI